MEPNILLIGKNIDSLEILRDELLKFDRNISIANSNNTITELIKEKSMDIAILGAGLSDETISGMVDLIKSKSTTIDIQVMEKKPGMNPTSMISYTNEKAVMWKLINARKK